MAKSLTRSRNATGYLHNLCSQGNLTAIKDFLETVSGRKQLQEQVGFLGYTPLHEAVCRKKVDVVKLLLCHGADPNAKANGFYTPLHMAALMDNVECVKLLLKFGADIRCKDEFQKTPYDTAIINKCSKAAKLLQTDISPNPGPGYRSLDDVKRNRALKIAHLDIRSLRHKADLLRLEGLDTKTLDILTLSETWLDQYFEDAEEALPGLICVRMDRTGAKKGFGGVAIYVRESLPFNQK